MTYLSKSGIVALSETDTNKKTQAQFNGVDNYGTVTPDATAVTYDFASDTLNSTPVNWQVTSGSYQVKNTAASPFGTATQYLECQTAGVISILSLQAYGTWEFDVYKGADANQSYINFSNINQLGGGSGNGYLFTFQNNESVYLYKATGSGVALFYTAGSYVANTTWYRIKIVRNDAGVFSVYIKASVTGEYVLVSTSGGSGTNPVTDNTYTTSKYFVLDLDAGDRIANLTMTQSVGQFDLNGYERISDQVNNNFTGNATHFGSDIARTLTIGSGTPTIVGSTVTFANEVSSVAQSGYWTIGKTYEVSVTISAYSGTGNITLPYDGTYPDNFNGGTPTTNGCVQTGLATYVYRYRPLTADLYMSSATGHTATVTINSIREVLSETNVLPAQDFTSGWTASSGNVTINSATKFTNINSGSILKSGLMTVGKTYRMRIAGYTTATSIGVYNDVNSMVYLSPISTGSFDQAFVVVPQINGTLCFSVLGVGTTEIFKMELYEIQHQYNDNYLSPRRSGLFNGTDNYTSVPDNANINFGLADFTASMFMQLPDYTPSTEKLLLEKQASNLGIKIWLQTDGKIRTEFGNGTNFTTYQYISSVATGFVDGTKNRLSITASRSGNLIYYCDGVALGTAVTISGSVTQTLTSTGTLNVFGNSGSFTAGNVYGVKLFNRALSAAEVLTYYNGGKPELYRIPFADFGANYTALTSGTLVTNKKYRITTFVAGDNFTNVGAGSNATGVEFTASGTTPTTWSNGSTLIQIGNVAEYKFNGLPGSTTVHDYSGNGNHGTVNGTTTNFWARENFGNHQIEISDVDKHAGVYSAKITSTGDGLGSELITVAADRDFSSDTGNWTKEVGWTISNGVASFNGSTATTIYLTTSPLTIGKTYSITYTISSISAGRITLRVGSNTGNDQSTLGTYTETLVATTNSLLGFYGARSNVNTIASIDNISVKEVLGYVQLPSVAINPLETGKKFTVEGWARGTGVLGSELVTNGGFDDATSWSKQSNWTISGGKANANVTDNNQDLYQTMSLTTGRTYKLVVTMSNRTTGYITTRVGSASTPQTLNTNSTYILYFITSGTPTTVVFTNWLCDGSVDNVTVKEITLPTVTLAIGNQSKTISSISCVPGIFTKLVWNFLATANEVNQPLKIFSNQIDQIHVDDVSITQGYDLAVNLWIKPNSLTNQSRIIWKRNLISSIDLFITSNKLNYYFTDGVYNSTTINANLLQIGYNVLASYYYNRISSCYPYINGAVSDATVVSGLGKLNEVGNIYFGSTNVPGSFYSGSISDIQLLRFYDIASSNYSASNSYTIFQQTGNYPTVTGGGAQVIYDAPLNDGHGYQIKDNSTYKKHGVLSGTYSGFWNNKPRFFEKEYTFNHTGISASSGQTPLLMLPANVRIINIESDIDAFDANVTLSLGISGNDTWLATITGTNVNASNGSAVDKAYSANSEKQLFIKKSAATVYGRIRLRFKFEYTKEL